MFQKWIDADPIDEELNDNSIVTVREWMAAMMVMVIPVINIVMLVYWAYADKSLTPVSKVNWARGTLIVLVTVVIACACAAGLFFLMYYLNKISTIKFY